MDSPFFVDTPPPWNIVSPASVTLATTDKALHTAAFLKTMGGQYLQPGKRLRLDYWGNFTSAATPGNFSLALYWGTGADAVGTILAQMTATAWTASQASKTWHAWFELLCTAQGAAGAVVAFGEFRANEASLAPHVLIPDNALAPVTIDTTTAGNLFSLQAKRSGSTVETIQLIGAPLLSVRN